jgi:hypothetical protein
MNPDPGETRDRFLEGWDQSSIELDGEHASASRRERHGKRPEAGTDLHDVVSWSDVGVGGDRAGEVGIDQKVLTERPRGLDPVASREISDRPGAESAGGHAR